mmetsp:Transcript_39524/g.47512  ORF Transcript_39524/g.47512 Transcript_39524/m.47512 type:complete len:106 (-) Transcript_39524:167-484(-)
MCTLELIGTKVDSILDIPPLPATLIGSGRIPGFNAVDTPITNKKQVREALVWFRRNELTVLSNTNDDINDDFGNDDRGLWWGGKILWMNRLQRRFYQLNNLIKLG